MRYACKNHPAESRINFRRNNNVNTRKYYVHTFFENRLQSDTFVCCHLSIDQVTLFIATLVVCVLFIVLEAFCTLHEQLLKEHPLSAHEGGATEVEPLTTFLMGM